MSGRASPPDVGSNPDGDRDLDIERATIVLASLGAMYPNRLRDILRFHPADEALALLRTSQHLHPAIESSRHSGALDALRAQAGASDFESLARGYEAYGVRALVRGQPDYPAALAQDPDAPEVLFARGQLSCLNRRRVGIVGTRNATAAGRATARQLGRELALAGVAVVSGLARGIDAAAHHGVGDAMANGSASGGVDDPVADAERPADAVTDCRDVGGAAIAVVGSGLDVIYPRSNRELWESIAQRGVLLSEFPMGSPPEAWHFPLRNRIIAALSEVLVVVESRESGGSLITARAAADRGVDVMAVPGSTYCRAAAGTNRLIADGAGVVCGVDDVLAALDLHHRPLGQQRLDLWGAHSSADRDVGDTTGPRLWFADLDPAVRDAAAAVFDICQDRPVTLDQLVRSCGAELMDVARAVAALEHCGLLRDSNGWFESQYSRLQGPVSPIVRR